MAEEGIANIGQQGRRQRFRFGVITAVVSIAIAVALVLTGVPRLWRLVLFLPLVTAGTGVFQAFEKT